MVIFVQKSGPLKFSTENIEKKNDSVEKLIIFAVLHQDTDYGLLLKELQHLISTRLNPLFKINDLIITDNLPRTASNKMMRRELRKKYLNGI